MKSEEEYRDAVAFMTEKGFNRREVESHLKDLLKLHQNEWDIIKSDSYSMLLDALVKEKLSDFSWKTKLGVGYNNPTFQFFANNDFRKADFGDEDFDIYIIKEGESMVGVRKGLMCIMKTRDDINEEEEIEYFKWRIDSVLDTEGGLNFRQKRQFIIIPVTIPRDVCTAIFTGRSAGRSAADADKIKESRLTQRINTDHVNALWFPFPESYRRRDSIGYRYIYEDDEDLSLHILFVPEHLLRELFAELTDKEKEDLKSEVTFHDLNGAKVKDYSIAIRVTDSGIEMMGKWKTFMRENELSYPSIIGLWGHVVRFWYKEKLVLSFYITDLSKEDEDKEMKAGYSLKEDKNEFGKAAGSDIDSSGKDGGKKDVERRTILGEKIVTQNDVNTRSGRLYLSSKLFGELYKLLVEDEKTSLKTGLDVVVDFQNESRHVMQIKSIDKTRYVFTNGWSQMRKDCAIMVDQKIRLSALREDKKLVIFIERVPNG